MAGIIETGTLTATIGATGQLSGTVIQSRGVSGEVGIPKVIDHVYHAGNGIVIDPNKYISIDELVIDCGRGTTV
jgi:hypothetical protein